MTQLDEATLNELVGRVLGDIGGAVSCLWFESVTRSVSTER